MIDISAVVRRNVNLIDQEIELDIKELEYDYNKLTFLKPVVFKGNITGLEKVVTVDGVLEVTVKVPCCLCMEEFEYSQTIDITETFSQVPGEDEYPITFDEIDLEKAAIDNILLKLPSRFVCKEDCKGLCGICGKNRNIEDCNCNDFVIDSRLEELKKLL